MDDALNIAMDYLIRTGQAIHFREAQREAAKTIDAAWKGGMRNRLRLTNVAIKAVERKSEGVL